MIICSLQPRVIFHHGKPCWHLAEVNLHPGKPLIFNLLCWMSKSITTSCCLPYYYYCCCLYLLADINSSWSSLGTIIVLYCFCLLCKLWCRFGSKTGHNYFLTNLFCLLAHFYNLFGFWPSHCFNKACYLSPNKSLIFELSSVFALVPLPLAVWSSFAGIQMYYV